MNRLSQFETSPNIANDNASDYSFSAGTEESVPTGHKSWSGHYFSKKVKHELECSELYLNPEKGTFHGDGQDDSGEFKWCGFIKDKKFLLKKKFDHHSVYFWGSK